jgi:hypothetical protein
MKKNGHLPPLVGAAEIAKMFRTTTGVVSEWVRTGKMKQVSKGSFDPFQAIAEWEIIKYSQEGGTSPRSVIEQQKAKKLQRENATAEGRLLPVEQLIEAMESMAAIFSQSLSALPGRIASAASMAEPAVLSEAVRAECSRISAELAAASKGAFYSETAEVSDKDQDPGPVGG